MLAFVLLVAPPSSSCTAATAEMQRLGPKYKASPVYKYGMGMKMCKIRQSGKTRVNSFMPKTINKRVSSDYVDVANSWMVQVDANAC